MEVLTDTLEQHRKETLHAISRARDKSLTSTTAVDKLHSAIERMNEKFTDIQRFTTYQSRVEKYVYVIKLLAKRRGTLNKLTILNK